MLNACYSSLDIEAAQFRTFALLPGYELDPICCTFSTHSLHENPAYETISYAWGDARDTEGIFVDKAKLEIPRSLATCLRHLRNASDAMILWADAICIDQKNNQEKAQQVKMMGDIFRRCTSVYIWLGVPRHPLDQFPFGIIEHFAADKHFHQLPGFTISGPNDTWEFNDTEEFQRILSGLLPVKYNFVPNQAVTHVSNLITPPETRNVSDMDTVLRSYRNRLCQDPRDRIYGLLGLVDRKDRAGVEPDYSLSIQEVYIQAMETILAHADCDLKCFTGSGFNSKRHQLPSWVRDFSTPLDSITTNFEMSRHYLYRLYDAALGTDSDLKVLSQSMLVGTGILVDEIIQVSMTLQTRDWQPVWKVFDQWQNVMTSSWSDYRYMSRSDERRFWRAMMGDAVVTADGAWNRLSERTNDGFEDWWTCIDKSFKAKVEPPITAQMHLLQSNIYGRAFFLTKKGYIGLGLPSTLPGDLVWVLRGGKTPFVLRRAMQRVGGQDIRDITQLSFYLIGDCYLQDFMDGEAFMGEDTRLDAVHLV
ncbi:heterokaryon incompatibility protein-domain-containing protein [Bipolaris maydis]|nr:heterokaryon incompatibility protein-domain-containing protein [Bipolaris maydis]KAJ6212974.1 heterokaryon incompatibility protein-domain-containing protein [Bipolaris maydis]KAJ6274233.1 heterokaryon incompatibility protein-domain-containing protein [Bipolaris maydis]